MPAIRRSTICSAALHTKDAGMISKFCLWLSWLAVVLLVEIILLELIPMRGE